MMVKVGLVMPKRSIAMTTLVARRSVVKCNYIPNYKSPDSGNLRPYFDKRVSLGNDDWEFEPPRKFWEYKIPTADIGSPEGYQLEPIGTPDYGPGDGNGGNGRGGWGGGGGGGNGGDPMKGFTYLFALLLFIAGLVAYIKKGSSKSLIISYACGILLLISASLMGHPSQRIGTLLALGTTLSLAGVMGKRVKESGKLVPGGVVAAVSALMSIGYVATLI